MALILNGHELNAAVDDAEALFLKLAGGDVKRDELVGWITANASMVEK